jgi:hypothetical protein
MSNLPRTDIARLSAEFCTEPFRRALPSALPERWLLPIVRDLRAIEESIDDETVTAHLPGPLLLFLHLFVGRMEETGHGDAALIPDDRLMSLMQVYQGFLEREITTRAIGQNGQPHDDELVAVIDRSIESLKAP